MGALDAYENATENVGYVIQSRNAHELASELVGLVIVSKNAFELATETVVDDPFPGGLMRFNGADWEQVYLWRHNGTTWTAVV